MNWSNIARVTGNLLDGDTVAGAGWLAVVADRALMALRFTSSVAYLVLLLCGDDLDFDLVLGRGKLRLYRGARGTIPGRHPGFPLLVQRREIAHVRQVDR